MKRTLILLPKARQDVLHADRRYEERRPGLGDDFLLEVQRCFSYILTNPNSFQRVYRQFHQAPVHRFPYVVVYRTDDQAVVVMRIFHTSQHPRKKFRRKK